MQFPEINCALDLTEAFLLDNNRVDQVKLSSGNQVQPPSYVSLSLKCISEFIVHEHDDKHGAHYYQTRYTFDK